jgi:hypothetical protein
MDAAAKTRSSAAEQAQNHRITKVIKQARVTTLRVAALSNTVGNLTQVVTANGQKLTDLTIFANAIDGRLKGIEAAAPTIIAGLTKLGAAYPAVEYGVAKLFYTNGSAVAGTSITSADIPDDGNAISTDEDAIVAIPTTAATTINLRAVIRSAESDGDDAAKTAGQAGGFIQVYNGNTGAPVPCAGSTAPLGIFGTQPGDSIVTPSGTVNTLPLKNIPGGNLRTDTTHPDGSSTSLLPAACTIPGATAGDVYKVHYSVNFLDIPTSTTPGPTE